MIKLKTNAIKTMADSLAKTDKQSGATNTQPETAWENTTGINRKLREAFNLPSNSKTAPEPQNMPQGKIVAFSSAQKITEPVKTFPEPADVGVVSAASDDKPQSTNIADLKQEKTAQDKQRDIEDLKKIKEDLERQQKEEARREEEKEEKQRQIKLAEEKKRAEALEIESRQAAERQRRAEAEKEEEKQRQIKLAEEKKRAEAERLAAQEKLRQERIRAKAEEEMKREEKRKQLAALETERQRHSEEERKRQKEERIAQEMRQKKEEAESLPAALNGLTLKLRLKKSALERQVSQFSGFKTPLEQNKNNLLARIDQIKSGSLAAAEKNEAEIEKQEAFEKTKLGGNLNVQEEKSIEQKLWEIEDRRKEAEKKRWAIEDEINKVRDTIKKIETEIDGKNKEEELIKQKIKDVSGQEKMVKFALEKGGMEQEVLAGVEERDALAPIMETAAKKRGDIDSLLQGLANREKTANEKLAAIEDIEKQTANADEKRKAEQERWQINETLKSIVKSKWAAEEKLKEAQTEIQGLQIKIDGANKKIDEIQNSISDREFALENENLPVRKIRDAISKLLKENEIEVNPDILNDIIQSEDITPAPAEMVSVPQNTQPQPQIKIPEPEIPEITIPARDEKIKEVPQPMATAEKIPAKIDAKANEKPAEPLPAQPPVNEKKLPQLSPITAQPAAQTKIGDEKIINSPASKAPKTEEAGKENPQTVTAKTIPASQEQPKTANSAAPVANTPVKIEKSAEAKSSLSPETKLNDIVKFAKPAEKPEKNSAAETYRSDSAYREQISVQPATNIRTFSPDNLDKDLDDSIPTGRVIINTDKKTPDEKPAETNNKPAETEETLEAETPAANVWENRWDQIKKTTTPPSVIIASANAEIPQQSSQNFVAAKPNDKNKTLVRVLIILMLVGAIGAAVALILFKNNAPANSPKKETVQINGGNDGKAKTTSDTQEPAKVAGGQKTALATIDTTNIYTEDMASVPNLLFPYLQTPFKTDGYHRIIIQNKQDNTTVGLKQFLSIFKVTAPSGLYSSVNDDFVLFIYSNGAKNRLGFVAQTDDPNSLAAAMSGWEGNIEKDTDGLFKLLGRKTQSATSPLKFDSDLTADNVKYRSLVFVPASDNFAISYAIYNGKYFIFTTSSDALTKIFNQLPK